MDLWALWADHFPTYSKAPTTTKTNPLAMPHRTKNTPTIAQNDDDLTTQVICVLSLIEQASANVNGKAFEYDRFVRRFQPNRMRAGEHPHAQHVYHFYSSPIACVTHKKKSRAPNSIPSMLFRLLGRTPRYVLIPYA